MDYPKEVVEKFDVAYKAIQEAEAMMIEAGAEDAKHLSGAVYDALEVMKTKAGNGPSTGTSATAVPTGATQPPQEAAAKPAKSK